MATVLNESQVLAKTRCQDLYSVYKINCWGSGIKDISLVRKLVNVEVIGLSCNEISSLEDFAHCLKLKELILRKNKIENIAEIAHLQGLPKLTSLWLEDNPCVSNTYNYRKVVLRALPNLTVLDNKPVTQEELKEIEELGDEIYEEIPYESSHSSSSNSHSDAIQQPAQQLPAAAPVATTTTTSIASQQQQKQAQPITATQRTSIPQYDASEEFNPVSNNSQQSAPHSGLNNTCNSYNPTHQTTLNDQDEANGQSESFINHQQLMNENIRDSSINFGPNDSRQSSSARVTQRPQSRSSMQQQQYQHCRSLNGQDLSYGNLNCSQNQGWSMNNLSSGNLNNNNNNNNILPKGGRSGKSNIVSAILCLIKELDYSSCEVVRTALHIHMEETSE